ncbi:MAG: RagB/SusD family nutrient uptake outer membrane protein [Gemmatimonas sp.]|uniref:RagB/SusD family nutrient uptake outer membrane protein n=1 Tax=Gemmatimonas sp. TaxID=1962908 RepID=UPI00391F1F47
MIPRTRAARAVVRASTLALLAVTAACGSLLDVDIPSRVPASDAVVPANAAILMNSVIGDFECAFGGAVVSGGTLGDELANSSTGNTTWQVDRRDIATSSTISTGGCGGLGPFGALNVTLWLSSELQKGLETWSDAQVTNRRQLLATNAAYAGYALLLMGEQMCTATIATGPELPKAQVWTRAEERFTAAIAEAQASNAADILSMAYLGRARARLNLMRLPEAAADARQVPANFVRNATFSSADPRRFNPVFNINNQTAGLTVGPVYRAMTFAGVRDPRVPVTNANRTGANNSDSLFVQTKYTSLADPIPIATWAEAQLIIAEAELAAGNVAAAVAIINTLHARTTPALPPFASTSAAEVRAQLTYERRAELFLESQHLGDFQRLSLPFVPATGAPVPFGGGFYGTNRCFPLPDLERTTNPNLIGR